MKLPPDLALDHDGAIVLNAAELGMLKTYIRTLQDQRDHARAWAAWHQANAAHERRRLHLLLTFGRTSPERAAEIIGEALAEPAELAGVATDGWIGMLADTSMPTSAGVSE